MIHKVLRP